MRAMGKVDIRDDLNVVHTIDGMEELMMQKEADPMVSHVLVIRQNVASAS